MPNNARLWSSPLIRNLLNEIETDMPRRPSNRMLVIDLSTPEPSSIIIHDLEYHRLYFRPGIRNDQQPRYYISQVAKFLIAGGLTYVEGTNYFFNNKCGVYILDRTQVVIHLHAGEAYEYETNTHIAYHLIGYLVIMEFIGLGSNVKELDTNDKYEF